MIGLDAAGKTTILYKLKLAEVVTTIPTIGFNVETVEREQLAFTVWDVGGRDKIRPLLRHYYKDTTGLIFVVDSLDRERSEDACEELHKTLNEDEMRDVPLLVFANKQDIPFVMSVEEITEALGLGKLRNRRWHVQPSSATLGLGLFEGLDWLASEHSSNAERSLMALAPELAPLLSEQGDYIVEGDALQVFANRPEDRTGTSKEVVGEIKKARPLEVVEITEQRSHFAAVVKCRSVSEDGVGGWSIVRTGDLKPFRGASFLCMWSLANCIALALAEMSLRPSTSMTCQKAARCENFMLSLLTFSR